MGNKLRLFYLTTAVVNLMAMVTDTINTEYWALLHALLAVLMFDFALQEKSE
jgi:hypothetical protein